MKILIIKPSSFGDIVQAAPCASALKEAYPGCCVEWVVFSQWEKLLLLFSDIDGVISWDRKKGVRGFFSVLSRIRKTEYDLVIDLQGLLRSALLAKFSKAKVKVGVPGMKECGNIFIKEVYPKSAGLNATLRNLEPVRFISGKTFEPEANVKIPKEAFSQAEKILAENDIRGNFVTLLPFARGKGKTWSSGNYLKLIEIISSKYPGLKIAILGSAGDFGKIKSDKAVDLCGKTGIDSLAAILSESKAAIGADTGPMHLAAVLQTPSVFIFGDSDINETAPYLGRFLLLVNKENPKDLNKITPEEVLEALEQWKK